MLERLPEKNRRMASTHEVTRLLDQWSAGKPGALEELFPMVYGELRFFAGISNREATETLDVAVDTVERDRRAARLWLHRRLSS